MNFGKWIVVSFVLFAIFIGTLVTICLREDISLVSKNYYKEELAYQDQIERLNNTRQLTQKPTVKIVEANILKVEFNQLEEIQHGELRLFCPSNSKMDKNFRFKSLDNGSKEIDLNGFESGMYKVKLLWSMHGKEFYLEEIINI
jgi:hypothetical protein